MRHCLIFVLAVLLATGCAVKPPDMTQLRVVKKEPDYFVCGPGGAYLVKGGLPVETDASRIRKVRIPRDCRTEKAVELPVCAAGDSVGCFRTTAENTVVILGREGETVASVPVDGRMTMTAGAKGVLYVLVPVGAVLMSPILVPVIVTALVLRMMGDSEEEKRSRNAKDAAPPDPVPAS